MNLQEASRYAVLAARLARAEELLESMQEASRPGSAVIDRMPRAAEVKDKVGDLIVEIDDLKGQIEYLKRAVWRERRKLDKFIGSINEIHVRMAFRLKFVRDLTWAQTAEILGSTEESIKAAAYRFLSSSAGGDS
jgi:DNA-directed RNA polymerase specialized sigma24 family protein